jgi:hypothetical protein
MSYNPTLQRWEGNEDALVPFSHPNTSTTTLALTTASTPTFAPPNYPYSHDRSHSISHTALSNIHAAQPKTHVSSRAVKVAPVPVPSPPRPALISQINQPRGMQFERGMMYDPKAMTWLKAPRQPGNDPRSPSVDMDDEEDPFLGIEDLKDNSTNAPGLGASIAADGTPQLDDVQATFEEFDVGPLFIRRQREEEISWRKRTQGWIGGARDDGENKENGYRWQIRNFATVAAAQASRY